jgi:asparagine synthetase B (glutamine-hydrolysing)
MCGIVVATCTLEKLNALNAKRGPDSQGTVRTDKLEFNGHVLHLRGDLCPQPLLNNDILCFNGEIYSGLEGLKDGNDTRALMAALQTNVMFTLSTIRGEWALVYYSYKENALYFGRDCLGRRSLLYHLPTKSEPYFAIASVSDGTAFDEIGTNGIYRLSLDFKTVHDIKPQLIAWNQSELKCPKFELAPCDSSIVIEDFMSNDPKLLDLLGEFRQTLYNSCQSRVLNIPPRFAHLTK